MAIIDNHKSVKIDKTFEDKHPEMFKFFNDRNIDVEVSDNFVDFEKFLTSLDKKQYPYNYDEFFNETMVLDGDDFALYLKKDNEIIATYAAKILAFGQFNDDFENYLYQQSGKNPEMNFDGLANLIMYKSGRHMYSSCQWVSTSHRGKGMGMMLDHLKKNICFDVFNADSNYAIHKEAFTEYHTKGLHYDDSILMANVPQGNVGGAGEKKDKIYNVTWVTKENWANKLDDVRKLYNR